MIKPTIKKVIVRLVFDDKIEDTDVDVIQQKSFTNTQDAQSYLQINKCYNKEVRHQ